MSELATEEDLARARNDAAFRQQLLADNLERLLASAQADAQDQRQPARNRPARSAKASISRSSSPTGLQETAHSQDPQAA